MKRWKVETPPPEERRQPLPAPERARVLAIR